MIYKNYTVKQLKSEQEELKSLKRLISNMNKPDNFTYLDIFKLHQQIDNLLNIVTDVLKEKQEIDKNVKIVNS